MTIPVPETSPRRTAWPVDLVLLTRRSLRREIRQVDGLLVGIMLPVLIMVAMVGVFGGAVDTGASGLAYVDYVAPAVMVLCAGYGAAMTGASIAEDMNQGMIQRFRTLPIAGWALPAGHVAAALLRNLLTTALAVLAALALGFRPTADLVDWLGVLVLLAGYVLAVAWLSVVWGLLVSSVQAAGAFSFAVLFVPYASSAFVPVDTLPGVLRWFAEHQPVTPLVDALRALLLGMPIGDAAWAAAVWIGGGVVLGVPLAGVLFRRRTRA